MRIVALGYLAVPATAGAQAPDAPGIERDDLPALIEELGTELGGGGRVVVVHPAWQTPVVRRRLETVRLALDSVRLGLYRCPLPPLAGGALVGLARAVAPRLPAERPVVDVLGALAAQLVPLARLSGVTQLETPAPTVLQHLWSLWPPSRFGVAGWPEPAVERLRSGAAPAVGEIAGRRGAPLDQLLVSCADAELPWVEATLVPALGGPHMVRADEPPLSADFWGRRRPVEAVALPGDLEAVVAALADLPPAVACRWCGEPTGLDPCPWCGIPMRPSLPQGHRDEGGGDESARPRPAPPHGRTPAPFDSQMVTT